MRMPNPVPSRVPLSGDRLERSAQNAALIGGAVERFQMLWPDHDRDAAVEAATDAYVRACQCFDPELGYAFSTYAYRCIRNALRRASAKAADRARKHRAFSAELRHRDRPRMVTPPPEIREPPSTAWLEALDPRMREVIELRAAGLTLEAVGERMGIGKERVRQILVKARQFYPRPD